MELSTATGGSKVLAEQAEGRGRKRREEVGQGI
jgi:hypothetical protein